MGLNYINIGDRTNNCLVKLAFVLVTCMGVLIVMELFIEGKVRNINLQADYGYTRNETPHIDVSHHTKKVKQLVKDHLPPTENLMKAGPFKFLPDYKNPCWYNPKSWNNTNELTVLCLPYFFLIGAPKCGTTDLHQRLIQHPQIVSKIRKEFHWFTRKRFQINQHRALRDYQTNKKYIKAATLEIYNHTNSKGRHHLVFGDCSASTLWDDTSLVKRFPSDNVTTADILYHLNPDVKILAMLRNPVDRIYSDYLYFEHGTPQEFHNQSVLAINNLQDCFKKDGARKCRNNSPTHTMERRLGIGLYSVHLQEWFRVFPRKQMMIIKTEDYSTNAESYMKSIFAFLDLAPPKDSLIQTLYSQGEKANARTQEDVQKGEMLPETRRMLQDFYRPFNDDLVKLLGKSFNLDIL